jgi:hypothetical protein
MFAKITRTHWKVAAALFSGVIAPLGVRVVEATLRSEPPRPAPHAAAGAYQVPPVCELPSRPDATQIVVQGTGSTPDEAFHNAVDAAVRHAVAAQVDAATWRLYGPALLESVRRDGTGIIRGWRELSSTPERHLTGKVYRSEVAVDVDGGALRERLADRTRGEKTQ